MEKYLELLPTFLEEANDRGETKLKIIQELTENFETILVSPAYSQFLEAAIPILFKFFEDGEPYFVVEFPLQQARKAVLELLHRLPANEVLRPYVRPILTTAFRLLGIDNEDNVLICLRIIIELHKQFRPQFSPEVQNFLIFVRSVYKDLPRHMEKIFEPKLQLKVNDLTEINFSTSPALEDVYSMTTFQTELKTPEGLPISYSVLPKARNSLKVLQELPIIVVLMYQIYKASVQQEVADFIPIVMSTITLQPHEAHSSGFNKEVLVEFMGAQVKTMSFLAYIIKLYQDLVIQHSELLVNGLINLLTLCPMEVAQLRRELFIAARHIMATELRYKFVPLMDQLFDEDILLGKGWTVNETMRPLAYSTLADLVHHVRQHLTLSQLNKAITFFSYHIHDETLPVSIHTMSCKLLFNLVESIRLKSESESGDGRQILMNMLDVLAYKFKTISQIHIPYFTGKFNSMTVPPQPDKEKKPESDQSVEDILSRGFSEGTPKDEGRRFGFPQPPMQTYIFHECRTLVKTVVCAVKTISWGIASCKARGTQPDAGGSMYKQFTAKETEVYLRLMKWGLKAVDIYSLNGPVGGTGVYVAQRNMNSQGVRSKEEKEVLEYFAGAFNLLNTYTFRELFSVRINLLVERIHENSALQVVANNLLANPATSAVFATILVEFLLEKLPDMGSDPEKSSLYLRLFKLVFGSVSLFPAENEQMLKPHLREIVNRSMELAMNAKDPYNYFLLLRALFRSIGGGSHDLLYQEFLPLLPSLLQGLNSLQSGLHIQHMKDLFVELCLTVPVRLSSLLPYLPMLMDPLVSALNGSPTLVSQGLRTLELCVDNLQPEFLYEHIQPVRTDLMQALWRTLRNPVDSTATVAYRILGKFGGSNRKMLIEPQKLEYGDKTHQGPQIQLYFQDHKAAVALPIEKAVETAYNLLKASGVELHYKRNAWNFLKTYLCASMSMKDDRNIVSKGMLHESLFNQEITTVPVYKYSDDKSRLIHATAISGIFVASTTKEIKSEVYTFLISLIRHYGMIAVAQQLGPFASAKCQGMDPYVIFDAITIVLAGEERELERAVFLALSILMNLLINMVGTKERACSLQMMEYLTEKICALCYERAWYTKMGGCNAIDFLLDHMSSKWILGRYVNVLKAMLFVLTDLSGEVSSGTVDAAKNNLEKILRICVGVTEPHLASLRESCLASVTAEFVRHLTSSVTNVREESVKNLTLLAELQGKTTSEVIQPHMAVIADMIPPKKHLIRHQSLQSQLGILDGNSFCLSLSPILFSIDFTLPEHRSFVPEIIGICESDDATLAKYPCYKTIMNLYPVRVAILKVLGCVVAPSPLKEKILALFLKSIANPNEELQVAAFEAMKKFMGENEVNEEVVNQVLRPMMVALANLKGVSLESLRHVAYLYQLSPTGNIKLWDAIIQVLRKFLEGTLQNHSKSPNKSGYHDFTLAVAIVGHFELLTDELDPLQVKYLELVCKLCLQAEKALSLHKGSPLRPYLMKYLARLPQEYVNQVFETYLANTEWNNFFLYFLKQPVAHTVRDTLLRNPPYIVHCLTIRQHPMNPTTMVNYTESELSEIQYLGVKSAFILTQYDESLLNDMDLFEALKIIWVTAGYQQGIRNGVWEVDIRAWKEPVYVCKLLLMYLRRSPDDIDLLFLLLLAFCGRPVSHFQFLKEFLEKEVTVDTIERQREIFFRFADIFQEEEYYGELKAKIVQYLLIPIMANCFDKGVIDELIGTPPQPDTDCPSNIVSILMSKVIDPDNPNAQDDNIRIVLCQLSSLMVDIVPAHIHDPMDATNKQGSKLRRMMTFAWPCLLSNTCVDSSNKYHGHLLLSHIIAEFAVNKRIVLQVFHSLLKACVMEAKGVIKQALDIITPAFPLRVEDGNTLLIHWTKKMLVDEGHSLAQLTHVLQLIVRHWKVYFPVRLLLITHIISAIQRLGFTPSSTFEHRRLAVELSEVIIKWELERIKMEGAEHKGAGKLEPEKSLERIHTDAVVNFLLRMACQVNDATPTPGTPGETLSRRCVALLRTVLKPHIWPNCDLKLGWFDKLFITLESPQANIPNICTALDLLTFITGILTKDQVLEQFKCLQKGISVCMVNQNGKVIRSVHNLMTKLMSVYPTDYSVGTATTTTGKCEELDHLYSQINKVVTDALNNYEKLTTPTPSLLLGPLMMLKSACTANPCYIDKIITTFMKVVQKLCKEHLANQDAQAQVTTGTDLLILSMDLVKNRVGVMGVEMRKAFIGTVLVSLIEKTMDSKVMSGIVKMLEEWVKNKSPIVINQGPSSREKSILLVKMMQNAEKRFPNDQELVGQFLELVNFIYRDDHLKGTELNVKLEPAFLSGLRSTQSGIRKKFVEVFDNSIRKRLHDRLMYIMCSQNWEAMGPHYWIKQCIELLFNTVADVEVQILPPEMLLPGIAHGYHFMDTPSKEVLLNYKDTYMEVDGAVVQDVDNDLVLLQTGPAEDESQDLTEVLTRIEDFLLKSWDDPPHPRVNVDVFLNKENDFTTAVKLTRLPQVVTTLIQLCHYDTNLAEKVWITFFPRAWKIFSEKHQMALANEMVPFLCSGVHVIQKDCSPSALNTFAEAVCQCVPSVPMKPIVLYYLGRNHNLWHRACMVLEQYIFEGNNQQLKAKKEQTDCYEFEPSTSQAAPVTPLGQSMGVMDALSDLYMNLREEDLWAGLWQRRAKFVETNAAIALINQGYYENAQAAFELAMAKFKESFEDEPCPGTIFPECRLWEDNWMKCSKELNQWEIVQEFANSGDGKNPILELDAVWRQGNWNEVKNLLGQVETGCPREFAWKVHLYRGYHAICSSDEQNLPVVDRYVDTASQICIKDWRRLPHIVSTAHVPILQAAQQIVELHEAMGIHQGFIQGRPNTVHDMKAVVKTWRNRLPCISDDLSHWGDIFDWRQHHYNFISNQFDNQSSPDASLGGSQGMLGIHASAQAICHFGKIARKQNLHSVALASLSKIYTIPSVPVVDCFQKIKQQVKCYIIQAQMLGKNELQEALDIVDSTNLKFFSKEMTSEFFTLKANLLALIGRADEASKCYSSSCQLYDNLMKCWGLWGDYLESFYIRDPVRNVNMGISAVTAYMQACRNQGEVKARKYIAKILWLLTYDDERGTYADIVDKYSSYIPPIQWLPWVPQLLTLLVRHDGKMVINLLNAVGRMYPQAVYFPIRTLYLTLKIEQREKVRSAEFAAAQSSTNPSATPGSDGSFDQDSSGSKPPEGHGIKATPSMWRCSRIMHMQRDLHPTVLSSLEGIVDQIVWFRENWYEEVLRQLKIGLAKCYAIAFENRSSVVETTITPQLQNFIRKLVSTFGHGIGTAAGSSGSSTIEALLRRSSVQDPAIQQMKLKFTSDFDTTGPIAIKLHNLILSLRKWIKVLEIKTKLYSKSFLMEDRFRFLQNFSSQMAEIELPGEFLIPKHAHYYVKIARFQPRVEVVQKHNTSARRIFIRGHNGKVYPYLIVNDSGLTDARREERVMQMLRMMNHYLSRQKTTAKRNLNFTVPKVVAVSPQMRLVEDNPSSLSLLDVFKHSCSKRSVEFDAAITRYYDKIESIQTRGAQVSHQVLREILRDIQANIVPRTMMKEWALNTFLTPSDYWMFRKTFTLQLALVNFAEYVFHLTRLNPEMMYLHQDSGMVNISYFKFELDDVTGELESNRPVPFRLTPNIAEFITPFGVSGPIVSSMISLARCFIYPHYKVQSILRALLRDEVIGWLLKKQNDREIINAASGSRETISPEAESEAVISRVTKSVTAIMNRIQQLSVFEGNESKVNTLVAAASSHDNLCRMDPTWHPWL